MRHLIQYSFNNIISNDYYLNVNIEKDNYEI